MLKKRFGITEYILSAIAIGLVISIFLKATFDMDTNYDVGWYHLPFAARIWGIVPESSFVLGAKLQDRYDGFPLLAHFFQGLLWKLTRRVQATNLVGFLSIVAYLFFLRSFFQIPLYLSAIAILTIPAVTTHAPTSFVDLPGNIGVSVAVMMIYRFFSRSELPSKNELLAFSIGAIVAANTKPQLTVLAFLLWCITVCRLIWLYFRNSQSFRINLISALALGGIVSCLIFATSIKNVALYRNPLYPTKIQIGSLVLNHKAVPETYSEGNRPQKWLQSILEINTPEWSADQFNRTQNPKLLDRAGGFFGAYVVFNLLVLTSCTLYTFWKKKELVDKDCDRAVVALPIMIAASVFTSNFPQSHELRYFMFWMIVLVSLNLSLIVSMTKNNWRWLRVKSLKLVYLLFFIVMCSKIEHYYLKPDFRSQDGYLSNVVDSEILKQVSFKKQNCLISKFDSESGKAVAIPHAFYYSSYFHADIPNYGIEVEEDTADCGNLNIIPRQN